MRTVGHIRRNFQAAINRAGMHDNGILLGKFKFVFGQAVAIEIFLFAGNQLSIHALALYAQHHHHIHIIQSVHHVAGRGHAHGFDFRGNQGFRPDHPHRFNPQNIQGMDLRARHPRMQDIADDGDCQVGKFLFRLPDSEHVQHRLGWVGHGGRRRR